MSEIDSYRHRLLGIIYCPTEFPLVTDNDSHRDIPIYQLAQDANSVSFVGKLGDLLIGGGGGESAPFRIAIPEAVGWYTTEHAYENLRLDQVRAPCWSVNETYNFGTGYRKLGWNPLEDILEDWLAQHVLAFLCQNYPDFATLFLAQTLKLECDGTICRMPTDDDRRGWGKGRPV